MIIKNIAEEKVKLVKATFGSKLGKKITSDILMPIMDQLEKDVPNVMMEAAEWAREQISNILKASSPSGRTYKIYEFDGESTRLIGQHTASAPGQYPAELTGTLAEAIEYIMFSDGSFRIGLVDDNKLVGTEFKSAGFIPGKGIMVNASDKAEKSPNKQTPVGIYGNALEEGFVNEKTGSFVQRKWFEPAMDEIRQKLRQRIRKNIRNSLNRSTRKISVRRAIVFKVYFR